MFNKEKHQGVIRSRIFCLGFCLVGLIFGGGSHEGASLSAPLLTARCVLLPQLYQLRSELYSLNLMLLVSMQGARRLWIMVRSREEKVSPRL